MANHAMNLLLIVFICFHNYKYVAGLFDYYTFWTSDYDVKCEKSIPEDEILIFTRWFIQRIQLERRKFSLPALTSRNREDEDTLFSTLPMKLKEGNKDFSNDYFHDNGILPIYYTDEKWSTTEPETIFGEERNEFFHNDADYTSRNKNGRYAVMLYKSANSIQCRRCVPDNDDKGPPIVVICLIYTKNKDGLQPLGNINEQLWDENIPKPSKLTMTLPSHPHTTAVAPFAQTTPTPPTTSHISLMTQSSLLTTTLSAGSAAPKPPTTSVISGSSKPSNIFSTKSTLSTKLTVSSPKSASLIPQSMTFTTPSAKSTISTTPPASGKPLSETPITNLATAVPSISTKFTGLSSKSISLVSPLMTYPTQSGKSMKLTTSSTKSSISTTPSAFTRQPSITSTTHSTTVSSISTKFNAPPMKSTTSIIPITTQLPTISAMLSTVEEMESSDTSDLSDEDQAKGCCVKNFTLWFSMKFGFVKS